MKKTRKMEKQALITGADGKKRCWWCGDDPLYVQYHDTEWGKPVFDDTRLFEKICLEGFQSGLSWLTILRKRENFRTAFDGFDIATVATYTEKDIERLLQNEGIIRHRGKIEATINNAQKALLMLSEYDNLYAYFRTFQPETHTHPTGITDIPSITPESKRMAQDLKKRGWKFVGPTTCYAFMQAMGLVNDHIKGCDFSPD